MRQRLNNLLAILSLLLCLTSLTLWFLSYSTSHLTGKVYVHWSKGRVYDSFFVFGAGAGQFALRFGHNDRRIYTTDSPEWPTLTPDARQRFVRWRNDNPDIDQWIFETESESVSARMIKASLIDFECVKPVGLDAGYFTSCPMWILAFLFAILPAFHFRKKIFTPLPGFPVAAEPFPA